jgi:hypothetical protein
MALLLLDRSVMVAGSNPNMDVNTTMIYPTTYTAGYFYPLYFGAKMCPALQNVPKTLLYNGNPFNITVLSSSYTGKADDMVGNMTVWVIHPGFTTHKMCSLVLPSWASQ